jgi:hypothetical protein
LFLLALIWQEAGLFDRMPPMKKLFMVVGMWLVGIASAQAFDLESGEVLRYDVYWGPLRVGRAQLEYVPQGQFADSKSYVLNARAWDQSSLIDLDDSWRVAGTHSAKKVFVPGTFDALQKENKYRADKQLVFNAKKKVITYTNRRDASDKVAPLAWNGDVRDVLSALYAWRVDGEAELARGGTLPVIGVKRPFQLTKQPAVKETVTVRGEEVPVWRVNITAQTPGKDDAQMWIIRLRRDATLAPVQAIVQTKFGTFKLVATK